MSRRTAISLSIAVVALLFAAGSASADNPPNFGEPLRGLTAEQLAAFTAGLAEFNAVEAVDEGLGPVFNEASCATCHSVGAVGGGSTRVETRFGRITNGKFDSMPQFGGSLIEDHAIQGFLAEKVPIEATIRTGHRTTPLFGLGLVDAVPDPTSSSSRH
jgi:CxxC motif-containing protein (DUF1111 family)